MFYSVFASCVPNLNEIRWVWVKLWRFRFIQSANFRRVSFRSSFRAFTQYYLDRNWTDLAEVWSHDRIPTQSPAAQIFFWKKSILTELQPFELKSLRLSI